MFSAFRQSDFSLLFAGTLVALSSVGIVTAYSLMNDCMGYLSNAGPIASSSLEGDGYTISRAYSEPDGSRVWVNDLTAVREINF